MKIKLDENLGTRGADFLRSAGHDVMTVLDQQLQGCTDDILFEVCSLEERVLITLDHDFGQVVRFPPRTSAGLIVLEPGKLKTRESIVSRLREFLAAAEKRSPTGSLWIVEPGRVRIHLGNDER